MFTWGPFSNSQFKPSLNRHNSRRMVRSRSSRTKVSDCGMTLHCVCLHDPFLPVDRLFGRWAGTHFGSPNFNIFTVFWFLPYDINIYCCILTLDRAINQRCLWTGSTSVSKWKQSHGWSEVESVWNDICRCHMRVEVSWSQSESDQACSHWECLTVCSSPQQLLVEYPRSRGRSSKWGLENTALYGLEKKKL